MCPGAVVAPRSIGRAAETVAHAIPNLSARIRQLGAGRRSSEFDAGAVCARGRKRCAQRRWRKLRGLLCTYACNLFHFVLPAVRVCNAVCDANAQRKPPATLPPARPSRDAHLLVAAKLGRTASPQAQALLTARACAYTWPGSNWRPSACEADVIATRPQVP